MLSPYNELIAINKAKRVNGCITIKEAIEAIKTVNNNLSYKLDIQMDDMLRQTDIENIKSILKELER